MIIGLTCMFLFRMTGQVVQTSRSHVFHDLTSGGFHNRRLFIDNDVACPSNCDLIYNPFE